jgi:hypothetical protein
MSTAQPPMPRRRIASILWFPIFFAIALPVTFEAAYHQPQPHNVPAAVVGQARQVHLVTDELRGIDAGGFAVRQWPSEAAATAAVRDREVAAAYVSDGPAAVYLARAAAPIRASYLQGVFARIAAVARRQPPPVVDLVPLAAGDGGTGIFFVVFPLMMTGVITAIVLLLLPAWRIGRRVAAVAAVGAIGTIATYLTAVSLKILPAALTFAFILSVPSSGGTVTPDLLPAPVPLPVRRAATGAGRERHPQRGLLPRRRYHATDTSDAVVGGHCRRHGGHRRATAAAPAATSVDRGQRTPAARAFACRTTPGPGLATSG